MMNNFQKCLCCLMIVFVIVFTACSQKIESSSADSELQFIDPTSIVSYVWTVSTIDGPLINTPSPDPNYYTELAKLNGSKQVFGTVNGEPIYSNSLLSKKLSNEYSVRNGLAQLEGMEMAEEQKDELRAQLVIKTEKEILDEVIGQELLRQEAERRGIKGTPVDEIKEDLENNYNMIADAAKNEQGSGKQQADIALEEIRLWMEAMDYDTLDEYFTASAEGSQSASKITELLRLEGADDTGEAGHDYASVYARLVSQLRSTASIEFVDPKYQLE